MLILITRQISSANKTEQNKTKQSLPPTIGQKGPSTHLCPYTISYRLRRSSLIGHSICCCSAACLLWRFVRTSVDSNSKHKTSG